MILHITTRAQWAEGVAEGQFSTPSLRTEGFIHCSKPEQIIRTANEYYSGISDLVLLCISPADLTSPLVFEDSYNKGVMYPHIYGPLNLEAVQYVCDFPAAEEGLFVMPDCVSKHLLI